MPAGRPSVESNTSASSRQVVLDALASVEQAINEHVIRQWGTPVSAAYDMFAVWLSLGELLYEHRAVVDPNGELGFPAHATAKHSPTVWEQEHSEQAARDAELAGLRPAYELYCWAAFYCLDKAPGGPCLAAFPRAYDVLYRADKFMREQVIWDHRPISSFLEDKGSPDYLGLYYELTLLTVEALKWLRQRRVGNTRRLAPKRQQVLDRQKQVAALRKEGHTGDEIAAQLHVHPSTISRDLKALDDE